MSWFDANDPDVKSLDPTNPIPTNPDGSQVGAGIPWLPGASQPSYAPPGYTWDANLAMFQPTTTGTAGSTSSGPVNGDWQGWFNQLFPGESLTPAQLIAQEAAINAAGGKVLRNAAGVAGKIQLPNGQIVDVIQGASSGLNRKQWLIGDASGGGAATGGGSLGMLGQGFGGLVEPFTGQFSAPTAAEAEAQPGYQFARDQGLQAINRSAAAKGTLLTGGTLKDLAGYAGGIASQNYNNVFNQGLQSFQTNRDTFYHNQDSPFNKYFNVASLGRPTTP